MSHNPATFRPGRPGIDRPYRVALVSYLNTAPFLEGLRTWYTHGEVELLLLPPSACARALRDDLCDCALVPVGSLPDFHTLTVLPEFCLGANGPVESVLLVGNVPIEEMQVIIPDPESRSSNMLARLLLRHYWKQPTIFIDKSEAFLTSDSLLKETDAHTGAVLIGDKAIAWRDQFAYSYDLAEYWNKATGLPFVFAVWASKTGDFPPGFREALTQGLGMIYARVSVWSKRYAKSMTFVSHYLIECMNYQFDAPKHKSFSLFSLFSQKESVKSTVDG